jgi:hypothetical protein
MPVFKPRYVDPFQPVLQSAETEVAKVTPEQLQYIEWILAKSCSDSQFARKAYQSINYVLTAGPAVVPVVTSLNPSSVVLGSPTFDVHVVGTGFTPTSVIVFNGFEEPTTVVSETELTTGVNMSVWAAPAVVPVVVSNNGVTSNSVDFTFNDVAARSSSPVKEDTPRLRR